MIAPLNLIPMVDFGGRRVAPFDPGWLLDSIHRAAAPAGHSMWWSEQVCRAVVRYLREDAQAPLVQSTELGELVRLVLERVGAGDVASRFKILPPRVSISLPWLAEQAGAGFELAFFDALRGRLEDALKNEVSGIVCYGIKPAVKSLAGRLSWRRRCVELEQEVVRHIQDTVAGAREAATVPLLVT